MGLPDVILAQSKFGISAETKLRNVGVPDEPFGEVKTRFAACEASEAVKVPEDVTGLPDTLNIEGIDKPTLVTVPVLLFDVADTTHSPSFADDVAVTTAQPFLSEIVWISVPPTYFFISKILESNDVFFV